MRQQTEAAKRQAMELNVFVLSTGFHYYFSTLLIGFLGLENVAYIMFQPREGIERRAGERYPVAYADARDPATRFFGKKAGKLRFALRAFGELGLAGRHVRVFSPYFNDSMLYALRRQLARRAASVEYNMVPDGAALLRHLPGKSPKASVLRSLAERVFGIEAADTRHKSGSYSSFLSHVYHFPAREVHADAAKLVIVGVPDSAQCNNGQVLVLGGLGGISQGFVRAARAASAGLPVRYRMHPKNRSGEQFIVEQAPEWRELQLRGILEEHLLADPYELVLGHYSSAVMFNQLFVPSSRSRFIIDRAQEDPDYHDTADACGIPVDLV